MITVTSIIDGYRDPRVIHSLQENVAETESWSGEENENEATVPTENPVETKVSDFRPILSQNVPSLSFLSPFLHILAWAKQRINQISYRLTIPYP